MHEDIKEHMPFLTKIALESEAERILELGVRLGGSTKAFLKAADILNAKVISIDIEDCSFVSDSPHWEFHQMNDLDYELKEKVDILFIDTSHTYLQTLKELGKFGDMANLIILHDTEHCPDVKKAIEKYLSDRPGEFEFENRTNNNGLGILWRIPQ